MKITEQTQDDVRNVCRHWYKYTLPTLRDLEGFVDDRYNADLLISFINYRCNGDYTLENLTAAAKHYKNNLHGVGVALSPAQKLEKENLAAQKKQDEVNAKAKAANDKIIADWIKDECPTGLIINNTYGCGDPLYGSSQDKITAFFRRNYPGQTVVTAAILNEAVLTLGPALDWFDRSPAAMELRNQPPPPPRVMTQQMRIECGLQAPRTPSHLDDKPLVPLSEVVRQAKEVTRKKLGMPSEEEEWQVKAEQISVLTKSGRFDYGKTADLRKSFAYNKTTGKIDWKETYKLRDQLATEILRRQQTS